MRHPSHEINAPYSSSPPHPLTFHSSVSFIFILIFLFHRLALALSLSLFLCLSLFICLSLALSHSFALYLLFRFNLPLISFFSSFPPLPLYLFLFHLLDFF